MEVQWLMHIIERLALEQDMEVREKTESKIVVRIPFGEHIYTTVSRCGWKDQKLLIEVHLARYLPTEAGRVEVTRFVQDLNGEHRGGLFSTHSGEHILMYMASFKTTMRLSPRILRGHVREMLYVCDKVQPLVDKFLRGHRVDRSVIRLLFNPPPSVADQ